MLTLGRIDQGQLAAAATDVGFLAHLERVTQAFDAYNDESVQRKEKDTLLSIAKHMDLTVEVARNYRIALEIDRPLHQIRGSCRVEKVVGWRKEKLEV